MKKLILATALAAISATTLAADYYLVVPVQKQKRVPVENIVVTLNSVTLPGGTVGSAYPGFDFNLAAVVTGDPQFSASGVVWSVVGGALPAGLTLSADGKLTGAPAAAGPSSFQLQASYKTKNGKQSYQVVVADMTVALAGAPVKAGIQGTAYVYDFKPSLSVNGGSPYSAADVAWSVSAGTLPTGLKFNSDGTVTGTPTVVGASRFDVTARYLGKSAVRTYDLEVRGLQPKFQLTSALVATQNFGTLDVGNPAVPLAISVVNAGGFVGSLTLPAFAGANPTEFSAVNTCKDVAPDANCAVTVSFKPMGSGSRSATLTIAGSAITFIGTGSASAPGYVVLTMGTAYQIPAGVTSVTAWAAGGGGGGGGSTTLDGSSGGGGGAGGLTWSTFPVAPGSTLSYAIGAGGASGYNTGSGSEGGQTSITYGAVSLTANGGMGGYYNAATLSAGGTWAGGIGGVIGGAGRGSSGDKGGGGGGAIGGVAGAASGSAGGAGGRAAFPGGLAEAFAAAGVQTGTIGSGAPSGSAPTNMNHGPGGTGYGHGAGGAGYYGGNGGPGALGGGGGGAAGYTGLQYGGWGGSGFIVLKLN